MALSERDIVTWAVRLRIDISGMRSETQFGQNALDVLAEGVDNMISVMALRVAAKDLDAEIQRILASRHPNARVKGRDDPDSV